MGHWQFDGGSLSQSHKVNRQGGRRELELLNYKKVQRICVFRRHYLGNTEELHRVLKRGTVEQVLAMVIV